MCTIVHGLMGAVVLAINEYCIVLYMYTTLMADGNPDVFKHVFFKLKIHMVNLRCWAQIQDKP